MGGRAEEQAFGKVERTPKAEYEAGMDQDDVQVEFVEPEAELLPEDIQMGSGYGHFDSLGNYINDHFGGAGASKAKGVASSKGKEVSKTSAKYHIYLTLIN